MLALLGVIGAGTAFVWATDLYAGYAWWLRLAGLGAPAALAWVALRPRNQCSIAAAWRLRRRLVGVLAVAVGR